MNIVQKMMIAFALGAFLIVVFYPEWIVRWTVRFDYKYYYDVDVEGRTNAVAGAAADLFQSGSEDEKHEEIGRRILLWGARRPLCRIPSPRAEMTGTDTVKLGLRHTLYTDATVTDFEARVNQLKLARDVAVVLITLTPFIFIFRGKPGDRPPFGVTGRASPLAFRVLDTPPDKRSR
jgi:hypothetical protein